MSLDSAQIQAFVQVVSQFGEFLLVQLREHQQRRPDIEAMSLAGELGAAAAGARIFLDDRHPEPASRQVCGGRKTPQAGADDNRQRPSARRRRGRSPPGRHAVSPAR